MRNLHCIFIVGIVVLACSSSPKSAEPEGSKEKPLDSLTIVNELLLKDKDNSRLYLLRAQQYYKLGDVNMAQEDLDRVLKLDTLCDQAYALKANYLMNSGDPIKAIEVLTLGIKRNPRAIKTCMELAQVYLAIKQNKHSIEALDYVLKLDIYNSRAYFLKGVNFIEIGDTALAISSFRTSIEQDNDFYDAYIRLGLIYAAQHDSLAEQYYRNALRIRPKSTEAMYNMAIYYHEIEELNKALKLYADIIKIDPRHKYAYYNMGYVNMYYLQMYDVAQNHFVRAIEVDPNYVEAIYNLGYCIELLGDYSRAEKFYRKALSIRPDYTLAAKGLERVLKEYPVSTNE